MKSERLRRIAPRAAALLGLVIVALLVGVKCVYGGGRPYPSVATAPLVAEKDVGVLVELEQPPGNVTRSRKGRVFFNTHPFARSDRFASAFLFELDAGVPKPYPDAATQKDLQFVFGMTVDARDRLWLTSPATLDRERTRLQAFDLATGARVVDRELAPGVGRFAQDLRVSPDGLTLYLADTGAFHFTHGAILVVDLGDFSVREVLATHPSTQPQDWTIRTRTGPYRLGQGLLTFAVGVDGLALSKDGAWLYYASMSHDTLFRIRTEHLRDRGLTDAELAKQVEVVGKKPLSDGIDIAPDGSVLVTDVENGGIARLTATGALQTVVRLDRVIWADGVTAAEDGEVLFTDSAIPAYIDPFLRPPSKARLDAGGPYRIYRFRLP
jgi:sugar lactone lactonase YvrE